MRPIRAAAIALCVLAAAPAGAGDPQIGRVLAPGEQAEAGSAVLRLSIGPNGRATGCAIEQSSGSAETDAAACRQLTRRGEWRSRRDAQGRRVGYEMVMEVFAGYLAALPQLER
ncbi:MAG TPA: TonB family protein [Allosphingosinicella sp.]|jgi:TonB family protein